MRPLESITVLEFCQYLSGPSASLRLADLGARVIKIERPVTGDNGRQLAINDLFLGDNSVLFHTINRNKESYVADLKSPDDIIKIKKLLAHVDILIHNFRPGVMEKLSLDYGNVSKINPQIIYGVISGYGNKGPWKNKPGQDLLIQAVSGLTWLSGDNQDPPIPFGLSIADYMCGTHLTQGILAALIRRNKTKLGAIIEVNLLASLIDFQFEVITTHLNDGGQLPNRALKGNAHAYLSAPYGIYKTLDGFMVLAMEDLDYLSSIIGFDELKNKNWDAFEDRDSIMQSLKEFLKTNSTNHWLSILERADVWCADVYNYEQFLNHEAFTIIDMKQDILFQDGRKITTTRCPIQIDGEKFFSDRPGPTLGQNTTAIDQEFQLI